MLSNMNAFLYINFVSGLGDTYSTIMSALECSMELEEFGYNTYLVLNTTRNQYLPHHIKLDCLFDFSDFKNEVIYNPKIDDNENPIIDGFNLNKLKQDHISYTIYVDEYTKRLDGYQSYIFGHTEINRNDRRPVCNTDIINPYIKKIAEDFIGVNNDLITLHYRAMDGLGNSEDIIKGRLKEFDDFISEYKDSKVLFCSNGIIIRDYLKNNHVNVISFDFTYQDIALYPCYDIYNQSLFSDDVFIKHAQEIMAEMVMIKYSKKILSVSPFFSNFVTYGLLNNTHNRNYNEVFKYKY